MRRVVLWTVLMSGCGAPEDTVETTTGTADAVECMYDGECEAEASCNDGRCIAPAAPPAPPKPRPPRPTRAWIAAAHSSP